MTSRATSRALNQHLRQYRLRNRVRSQEIGQAVILPSGAGGMATIFVAAVNATPEEKALASEEFTCDGVDDHVQIDAALARLADSPDDGGTVWLSSGQFSIGAPITWPTAAPAANRANITLRGLGKGTWVYLAGGSDSAMISPAGADSTVIADMRLDGNAANNVNGPVIDLDDQEERIVISNLYIHNADGDGIEVSSNTREVIVDGCYFESLGSYGIEGTFNRVQVVNCYFQNCTGAMSSSGSSTRSLFANNISLDMGGAAVSLQGDYNVVIGNVIHNSTGDGIAVVGSGSSRNVIVGNMVQDGSLWGIDNAGDNNVIVGNMVYNNTSGAINDTSTGSVIQANHPNTTTAGGGGADDTAVHVDVAGEITAITEITDPLDDDELIIEDASDSDNKKSVKIRNLPFTTNIDGFGVEDLAASLTDSQLYRNIQSVQAQLSFVAAFDGDVIGISVASTEARTAGTATFEVFVEGTGTGLTAVLDGTDTTYAFNTQAMNLDAFVAGDLIDVRVTTDGDWAPTTADVEVIVHVRHTG